MVKELPRTLFRRIAVGTRSLTQLSPTLATWSFSDRAYVKEQNVVPKSIAAIVWHLPVNWISVVILVADIKGRAIAKRRNSLVRALLLTLVHVIIDSSLSSGACACMHDDAMHVLFYHIESRTLYL